MIKTLSKIYQFSGKMQETMKKAILFSVLHSLFDMMSFGALAMVFSGLTDGFTTSMIWMIFGITLASMLLKIYCSYISDFGKVQIGYFMCAEKRIHIGDRMKYMPMGYFNDHNLGNLTSVVTTTMGDIENNASMVLTNILGGYIHAAIITIVMLCIDWRIGLTILCGILLFTWCIGRLQKKSETVSPQRQQAQEALVSNVLEYVQGMLIVKSFNLGQNSNIVFDDVSFSYGEHQVLDHVSLTIPERTVTAIVGPSGAGKSTLCNLIARFWDVDGGKITIGGVDVRDYTLDSLLTNISEVFQKVYLFADTIENNIKFGNPAASHEEVVKAAQKACCHEFIMSLPDGYGTVIGEGGATLSGGEKQRISIARAILKDAPIIILDEATSSVDPENENLLMGAIAELTKNKTVIMIAHRLKTVRNADQIFVLSGGHIVQTGKHEDLIRQPGIYADFIGIRKKAIGWKLK